MKIFRLFLLNTFLLFMLSCESMPGTSSAKELEKMYPGVFKTWVSTTDQDISLKVSKDMRLYGFSGCNNYMGSLNYLGQTKIKVSLNGTTRKACPEMNNEVAFLDLLKSSDRFELGSDGKLRLYKKNLRLLTFK